MLRSALPGLLLATVFVNAHADEDAWGVDASVLWVSDYLDNGITEARQSIQPEVVVEKGMFFGGVWANRPVAEREEYVDEVSFHAGVEFEVAEDVEVALLGTYYWFPDGEEDEPGYTRELELEVELTMWPVAPSVELAYDIDMEQVEVFANLNYEYKLAGLLDGAGVVLNAGCGYVHAEDPDGDALPGKTPDGYAYAEVSADFVYSPNENVSLFAGPRFTVNNNGADANVNGREARWWAAAGVAWAY